MFRLAGLTIAGLVLTATPGMAAAILINPTLVEYQMSSQSPCVIGGSQCNSVEPDGFTFTLLPTGGGTTDYTASSPVYTAQQIETFVGAAFNVGIDVNSTTGPLATEHLVSLEMWINTGAGWVLHEAYYSPDAGGTQLAIPRNGTGWSDVLLTSELFNVGALADSTLVQFKTVILNATDGRENIFLINTTTPPCTGDCDVVTPEPATLALLGSGVLVAGLARLRRRREEQ